jgi:murein DD-endopeptidase MepM/ murein hydrolase activator NlpD
MRNARFIAACSVALIVASTAYAIDLSNRKVMPDTAQRLRKDRRVPGVAVAPPIAVPLLPTRDHNASVPLLHTHDRNAAMPPLPTHDRKPIIINDVSKRAAIAELRKKHLGLPVKDAAIEKMKGSFYELRGAQMHEAVDILQPRNTPVLAVEDGVVAKLFTSRFGGLTIYQFDPTRKYIYYYAHLEKYADGLRDGAALRKGQVIGFVGTSGNAPPNTPHLHFSISILGQDAKWWHATAVDPYEVFSWR